LEEQKAYLDAAKEGRDLDLEVTVFIEHGTSEFDIMHSGVRKERGEGERERGGVAVDL
jgi:hypothetical protein